MNRRSAEIYFHATKERNNNKQGKTTQKAKYTKINRVVKKHTKKPKRVANIGGRIHRGKCELSENKT
jgi:hypothetical protein